ncbi:uncharacterized protein LOC142176685 [Nicotiana tabacum]|uniref:Uncharacterized protein LOC142176685 n=1 Tax=Nicotiana tabacum TaxID=4097 RepID=A0AC58TUP2_TOBAC
MHDFIMAKDFELWDVICDGPYIPTKNVRDLPLTMSKTRKEYTDADKKAVEKNFHTKKILVNKLVRNILSILSSSWEIKVNAITKAKDLQELTIDELVGNLKTYEMKSKIDSERREPKKEKNLVLKAERNDSREEDSDMAYLTKRGNSSKPKNYDLCHKCGKPGHFIKDCPLLKQEHSKYNPKKAAKRNPVPDKLFKRKRSADNVVKQALAAWGDSSSESEDETNIGDNSMMAVKSEENEYDSIFALMAQSDDDEDDDNSEVNFKDIQRNLKSYSPKKLMSLTSVLIDAYHSLVDDKDALTLELGEPEQTRDDLEVDDLVVVAIDYEETTENFSKEKEALVKRVTEIEEERDDLLIVIVDLRETIEGLITESKHENSRKGKEVASEAHIRLENELKAVRTSSCVETKKNKHLQTEMERVKNDLEKSPKWTWSSEAITAMYVNNGGNMQGIGLQREKTLYNRHSKYVTGVVKGSNQQWFMDSGCSKVGKVRKSLTHSIENVYYVNSLKYRLLSVSQICDKGNKVEFLSKICTVTNLVTSEVVLVAKRCKNIYVADFESIQRGDLSCLKVVDDDAELWYKRLGHASFSLLNKLIQKDMVRGLPMSKFNVKKVYDSCARGKHVKSSFKSKNDVITSKPLDFLHMDLCGPMRVQSKGKKKDTFF